MVTLTQALILAFVYWFTACGWLPFVANLNWPVVNGLFIGLIMGDPIKGTILGGTLQTMNMAPSMVGNTITMDMKMAAFISIPIAMATGMETEAVIAMAVPFTVIGAFIQPLTRTIVSSVGLNMWDKAAQKGNTGSAYAIFWLFQPILHIVFYFIPVFLAIYYGQVAMSAILNALPVWLMSGFIALGKLLPAIGFAMFLKSCADAKYFAYFFLGFYIMWFLSASVTLLGVTIIAAIVAWLVLGSQKEEA